MVALATLSPAQADGITKARLMSNLDRSPSDQITDNDAYAAWVCASAGLSSLPLEVIDSYVALHTDKDVAALELAVTEKLLAAEARAIEAALNAEAAAETVPTAAWPSGVPAIVSMAQARIALFMAGKLALVDAAIAALPSPNRELAQIEWEFRPSVRRDSLLVAALGPSLGLDDAAIDALFIAAAGVP